MTFVSSTVRDILDERKEDEKVTVVLLGSEDIESLEFVNNIEKENISREFTGLPQPIGHVDVTVSMLESLINSDKIESIEHEEDSLRLGI